MGELILEDCGCCGCRGCPDLTTLNVTFTCGTNGIKNKASGSPACTNCASYCSATFALTWLESVYIEGQGCVDYWEGPGITCAGPGNIHWIRCAIEYFNESLSSDLSITIYRNSTKAVTVASFFYANAYSSPTVWNCSDTLPDLVTGGITQVLDCQWSTTSAFNQPVATLAP